MPTYSLNSNGLLVVDQREIDYLSDFLTAGDRAGFYIAYYNMTGSLHEIGVGPAQRVDSLT